jgi:hypothetical protein
VVVIRQILQSHVNQENREMEEAITMAKAGDRARYDNDVKATLPADRTRWDAVLAEGQACGGWKMLELILLVSSSHILFCLFCI